LCWKVLKPEDFISSYGKPIGKLTQFLESIHQFFIGKGGSGDGEFVYGDVYTTHMGSNR